MSAFRFPITRASKAFYEKALAPLGYALMMEVQQNEHDAGGRALARAASRTSGSAAKAG